MRPQPSGHTHLGAIRRLLAVVVAACVLGAGSSAWAAGLSAPRGGDPVGPGHSCRCETVCSGRCCCVKTPVPRTDRPETPSDRTVAAGPCLDQAPCGSGEVPNAPPGTAQPKAAMGDRAGIPSPVEAGALAPPPSPLYLPPALPSPDDPPERLA